MRHLPAIDGLRAVAVLAVVAYHAGLPVPAGFVGVDVFFVISGYVITRMLVAEHAETGRIDLAAFYARRVRRILPALVVVVAATLALSAALLSADLQIATNRSAMAAMAMGANVWFQLNTGYFDVAADTQPLLHLWSLGVEEQFYLLWPLLLVASVRRPWALACIAVASFVLSQAWPQEVAFYQMPARFWELAVGGLIAFAPARSRAVFAYVGLAILAVAVMVPLPHFPGVGAIPAVMGAALVIHAAHGGVSIPVLQSRPVVYVGLISYGLYLWHWPLLVLHKSTSFATPPLHETLLVCALAFVLAALSYHFIELPFRRTRAPKFRAIALGVATCSLLAGCAAVADASVPRNRVVGKLAPVPRECFQGLGDAPALPPASCGKGDVVLWGDSHAHAWRPLAERYGKVYQLTRFGCPPMIRAKGNEGELCEQFNAMAVGEAKRGRVVILAARWIDPPEDPRPGLTAALAALQGVPKVIVLGPVPVMPENPASCIAEERQCGMTRSEFDRKAEPVRAFLRDAVAKHSNAELIDPTGYFCTSELCPATKAGVPLYFDDDHISAQAARAFALDDEGFNRSSQ